MIGAVQSIPTKNVRHYRVQECYAGTADALSQDLVVHKKFTFSEKISSSTQNAPAIWETSSTAPVPVDANVQQILRETQAIFRAAVNENFEFGMDNEFIISLELSIERHGFKAVEAIASIILKGQAKPQVVAEALRWLGDINHYESYQFRLRLLEVCLLDPSRWVRDGAALGLEAMNDRHAIPFLRAAIVHEHVQELRKDMESVLNQLEHTS